jgi:hypothetical protein
VRTLIDDVGRDIQFALRSFRREPSVAAGIVATFALAIGANAAMVGLVTSLMFSALPGVVHADEVARLRVEVTTADGDRYAMSTTSYPVFRAAESRHDAFSAVAASSPLRLTIGDGAETTEGDVVAASGDYFALLGVHPVIGRLFGMDDDVLPSGSAVAVLSHPYWQRRFGGSVGALGSHIVVDGIDYTIIGVAPRDFTGDAVSPVDLFVPLTVSQRKSGAHWMSDRGVHFISIIARVRDRAALPRALGMITAQLRADAGDEQVLAAQLVPSPSTSAFLLDSWRSRAGWPAFRESCSWWRLRMSRRCSSSAPHVAAARSPSASRSARAGRGWRGSFSSRGGSSHR